MPSTLNPRLFGMAEARHAETDTFAIPSSIRVVQIAGWGLATIKGVSYGVEDVCVFGSNVNTQGCTPTPTITRKPLYTTDGDGTVVTPSATFLNGVDNYYLNLLLHNRELARLRRNRKHRDIFEVEEIQTLLNNIIVGQTTLPENISTDKPVFDSFSDRLELSVHSPVSLDVYDSSGLHTGIVATSTDGVTVVEESIPNSFYNNFGEAKYVGVDNTDTYNVKVNGTDFGTFTLQIEKFHGDQSVSDTSFVDIPVTPMTVGTMTVSNGTTSTLTLDIDGNGTTDTFVDQNKPFDPISYLSMMKIVVVSLHLDPKVETRLIKRIDATIKVLQKGKIKNAEKKIQQTLKNMSLGKGKFKKIDSASAQKIITLLDTLLDNLN